MGKIYQYENWLEPIPNISLGKQLLDHLRKNGDNILMVDGVTGQEVTHKEIYEKSVKLAKFLHRYGIKLEDRIAICSENRKEWIIVLCATLFVGAIITPYNYMYTEHELRHVLSISNPRIIFVSRRTERTLAQIQPNLSWHMELIQLDDQPFSNVRKLADILEKEKVADLMEYKPVDIGDNSKHPAIILCSSGTTGLPKEVALSHKNLLSLLLRSFHSDFLNIRLNERILLFLPFYHGYAFGVLLLIMCRNGILFLLPTFDPELFLTMIQKYKISYIPMVPPILTFLAKHPLVDKYDLSSVRQIVCGAAPFTNEIVNEVRTRTGIKNFRNGYGMTELTILSNISLNEDDAGSGPVLPGFFSKVINPETQETLDVGQTGEICFKGDQVMMRYWNDPEATKETIDQDGWLHTGDIGYYDEKSRMHVVGRLKELIKYKGYQVSPSEVEGLLLSHPAVKDAAVSGKPDEFTGELPMAFIVRKPNVTVTAQDIQEFIKQKLSPQKWLRGGVQFVDAIPKNPTGKILRRELQVMMSKL